MRHATGRSEPHPGLSPGRCLASFLAVVSLAASGTRLIKPSREQLSYGASGVVIELTLQHSVATFVRLS